MKAAFLEDIGRFEIREVPIPEIKENEVLVRIKSVGICGSDVHYYKSGRIGSTKATFPYIIGHECSGIIESAGMGVDNVRIGDKVAVEPAIYCYKCRFCKEGRYNICSNVGFLGTPPVQGAYSEYIAVPKENVFVFPEGISFEEAVLLEPLAIAVHASGLSEPEPSHDIAVYGCGTIGLGILSVIREKCKGRIFAIDRLNYRLDIAKMFGADYVINSNETDPVKFILGKTGYGVHSCFEASGSIEAMRNSAQITSPGGIAVLGGIPEEDDVCFDAHSCRRKELQIKFLRRSNCEIEEAAAHYLRNRDFFSKIITHRMPLDEIAKGFEITGNYEDNVIKAVINC